MTRLVEDYRKVLWIGRILIIPKDRVFLSSIQFTSLLGVRESRNLLSMNQQSFGGLLYQLPFSLQGVTKAMVHQLYRFEELTISFSPYEVILVKCTVSCSLK